MKKIVCLLCVIFITSTMTACNSADSSNSTSSVDTTENQIVIEDVDNDSIYFYGEYIIEGAIPSTGYVCDRIVFFPDGKSFVHVYHDGVPDSNIRWFYYSYCNESNYIGFSSENSSFFGLPSMSENRTLLKFDDYVLKLVDNN